MDCEGHLLTKTPSDLPAEIRNQIYDLVVCTPNNTIHVLESWSTSKSRRQATLGKKNWYKVIDYYHPKPFNLKSYLNFKILCVSKKVNQEAMGILYGQQFNFDTATAMQNFLTHLRPDTIGLMQHINCDFRIVGGIGWRFMPAVFSLIRPATNMKSLRLLYTCHFHRRFDRRLGPAPCDGNMTVEEWDRLVARNIAREAYTHLHPWLQAFVRARGPGHIKEVLDAFRLTISIGPHLSDSRQELLYRDFQVDSPNDRVSNAPWTPERQLTMREEIPAELERLVAGDAI